MMSASVLRRGLDKFCLSSGLRPNMANSIVYFGNVPKDIRRKIMDGPLCKLINYSTIIHDKFILNTKLADIVLVGERRWQNDWNTRLMEVIDISVPRFIENHDDKVAWINNKGLKLKVTKDVIEASEVWNFPIDKYSRVFMEGLWKWCSMDRWPIWIVEKSALKNLGPWKTGWCYSDFIFMLLGFLECHGLVDYTFGFLSVGMVMGLQDMRYFDWNGYDSEYVGYFLLYELPRVVSVGITVGSDSVGTGGSDGEE
uniref:RNA-directed DNA polymerase, eukaryota, reverse transcriptase zinc-binding domain protein n=1 Tax=Tanacetum cinerariifolium TaxID=118510 RepID=A0A699JDJ2_TANCI|nr:hypothetical protein [Tanacetum cinerariifolium]